jgi:hypothetical protein
VGQTKKSALDGTQAGRELCACFVCLSGQADWAKLGGGSFRVDKGRCNESRREVERRPRAADQARAAAREHSRSEGTVNSTR